MTRGKAPGDESRVAVLAAVDLGQRLIDPILMLIALALRPNYR
jgi:hypothetical protein